MGKENMSDIYYKVILFSHKKKKAFLPFVITWMKLEGIMLSEISQAVKDKYCIVSLLYEMFKKKLLNS